MAEGQQGAMIRLDAAKVAALREDVVGATSANTARKRLGVEHQIVGPVRVRIRIGVDPVDYAHMNIDDFQRRVSLRVVYRKRPPRCRGCGEPIGHGDQAVQFSLWRKGWWNPITAFVHFDPCPELRS